ncbi:MAG: fimbrial protein [Odoribacter sp.]
MKIRLRKMSRLLSAALLPALLLSCADEEIVGGSSRVQEGLPARIALKVVSNENRIETRAAQPGENEQRVTNLYLLVFDEYGKVCDGSGLYSNLPGNSVILTARSKNGAQIAGIANVTEGNVNTTYQLTESQLKAVTTKTELLALLAKLDQQTLERSSQFIMSGWATDIDGNDIFNIPGSENSGEIATFSCNLKLSRLDAKVEFVVKTEIPDGKAWKDLDFRPKGWRVVNVPAQSLVLPKETGDADSGECTYFNTDEMPFETVKRNENYLYESGGFVFYMPENRKPCRQEIPDEPDKRYALREERDKINEGSTFPDRPGQKFENGPFTYAPENATYVEMSGILSYKIDNELGYEVNADVTFTVHLGYADGNPNDYDTKRNKHYIYTVTIRGINDIELEVTSDEEENESRPGYEGSVIYCRPNGIHELDAHYERELITIDYADVEDMTWGVQTPFDENAIFDGDFSEEPGSSTGTGSESTGTGINDYRWIKFAINEDYGRGDNEYVKYPGDQNYAGGDDRPSNYSGHSNYPEARLLDVHQLLRKLKTEAKDKTGSVTVTAFIDEYVYVRYPWDTDYESTNNYLVKEWRRYVEAPDRKLFFIKLNNSKYSPDGASSVMEAVHTFRQKSIRTVYNVNKSQDDLPTAWGLESTMEGKRLPAGDVSRGTSPDNGRENTLNCLFATSGLKWTDVLDVWTTNHDDKYGLKSGYNDALHAVLTRNRDLDGDDIVDPEEIQWYLASKDQLVDLYIGEYALDEPSRLYPTNPADRDPEFKLPYWHYTTSSSYSGSSPWILWAEECVALSGSGGTASSLVNNLFTYRCVRNLGIHLTSESETPVPLIPAPDNIGNGIYEIDCSFISEKGRRQSMESGNLPVHNDLSSYNRPYTKFQVAADDYAGSGQQVGRDYNYIPAYYYWQNWHPWSYYQNIQPSGYRVPNLRELLIMGTRLPQTAWKTYNGGRFDGNYHALYMSFTTFSRGTYTAGGGDGSFNGEQDKPNKTGGFRLNMNDGSIGATGSDFSTNGSNIGSDGGYVRGVKDIQ